MAASSTTTSLSSVATQSIPDDATVDIPVEYIHESAFATLDYGTTGQPRISQVHVPRRLSVGQVTALQGLLVSVNSLLRTDSPAPSPILPLAAKRAVEYLSLLVAYSGQQPDLYPLSDQGVLAHWDRGDESIDIEFDSDGDVVALVTKSGSQESGYLHQMWRQVATWMFAAALAA